LTLFKRSFSVQVELGGDIGQGAMLGGDDLQRRNHLLPILLWQH